MCKRLAADRTAAKSPWPFCSERCRLIDLGKWLGEDYRVPDPDAGPPEPSEQD
jgi:endogenous inhibitor of DNA gyrase (YacG/DUF329 family)